MSAGNDPTVTEQLLPKPFDERERQLVELWRYFEGVGNSAKTQMTATATWLLAFASGTLSYTLGQGFGWPPCLRQAEPAYVAGGLGIALCVLTLFMIREFWRHTQRNWWRATRCKNAVPALHQLVTPSGGAPRAMAADPERFRPDGRVASIFALYSLLALAFLLLLAAAIAAHWLAALPSCRVG